MSLFIPAYLAGVLTILSPCILPVVPFVLAQANRSFHRQSFLHNALPMLLGLALAFAAVASLAAVAGGWAVQANRFGRAVALVLLAGFGLSLVFPALATRLSSPLVGAGSRLAAWTQRGRAQGGRAGMLSSVVLGVATGLLWTPCAGPVLGLILSGAALSGPGPQTSALLLAYGLGAATSLAAAMLAGRQLLARLRPSLPWVERARRLTGAMVIGSVALLALGLDTSLLQRLSAEQTAKLENTLMTSIAHVVGSFGQSAGAAVPDTVSAPLAGPLAALLDRQGWINSPPLRTEALRGKVVVVSFWTYSCINCLRALPHLKAWADRYKDQGLVVIGVHAPEFAFERDRDNVARASLSLGLGYPVVLDNDFRIWRAFGNSGWPGIHIVGSDGRIRHQATGEGRYDQSEQVIRRLLTEANATGTAGASQPVDGQGTQKQADWSNLRSPETYLGHDKAERFASAGSLTPDEPREYRHPATLPANFWSLSGNWTVGPEFAALNQAGGGLRYRVHARDLHLVLVPGSPDRPVRFRVRIDGAAPGASHGSDIDEQGFGTIRDGRLYQLVRQAGPVAERTVEIEFLDPGVRAYAFTFG
ncbi:cytochrome c biogenesis protein CcdA [Bosea psychrotolerans]|uniref:Cytochrome c biogenesis protein CcdA n=1 Tax=Bosea psychrotolerans TaxID=1871628 RepID=A0A2S4MDW5_9HYPH|nr:cytochrome c biogenesis protein CcdA [Bosea psychrotolerans]POR52627.1 cytochrome c biogenesis protein CcdA [Bosea psychrotolerans]